MKTSFKYMALGLGLLTMASCNDFLDREPKSDITPQALLHLRGRLGCIHHQPIHFQKH